jgi:hypothetical protein
MKTSRLIVSLLVIAALLLAATPAFAAGKPASQATGGIWMSGPSQKLEFNAFDYGPSSPNDKGTVEYWNYDYAPSVVLHYSAKVLCATVSGHDARFMYQIPDGWPGLSGLYIVMAVHDGGTPGTNGDTWGFGVPPNLATAQNWCEVGGFTPQNYLIVAGNLVVHK